ncbi:peroxiredoxin [Desulfonatronovibrio hydrogenovorans]|uniref:peroxiredoxin n=1 Tax=Desulfonatronovibrio hydrogenovorans TaxID=53245 RepID=UPI00048ED7BD|nr:peroxiredoxin [Desulfonatronovibrio hydrogenovorans]
MRILISAKILVLTVGLLFPLTAASFIDGVYRSPEQKPVDSQLKVQVGDVSPDFTLPCICGEDITLSQYRGRKNVMLSFVPAAWTPVCSDQWPGYNIVEDYFARHDAIILGISVDSVPTLYSWMQAMGGLWFPVLSDFWPHGEVAEKFGVLRTDGTAERAVVLIDKQGVIRFVHVEDINVRPRLELLINALEDLPG